MTGCVRQSGASACGRVVANRAVEWYRTVRQQQGRFEIDLLAELAGGRLVGIEVKADAAPRPDSARHLAGLRDRYGDAFTAGIVLHSGPRAYRLGDRLTATPISTLWA